MQILNYSRRNGGIGPFAKGYLGGLFLRVLLSSLFLGVFSSSLASWLMAAKPKTEKDAKRLKTTGFGAISRHCAASTPFQRVVPA